jgi:hypothetical protein
MGREKALAEHLRELTKTIEEVESAQRTREDYPAYYHAELWAVPDWPRDILQLGKRDPKPNRTGERNRLPAKCPSPRSRVRARSVRGLYIETQQVARSSYGRVESEFWKRVEARLRAMHQADMDLWHVITERAIRAHNRGHQARVVALLRLRTRVERRLGAYWTDDAWEEHSFERNRVLDKDGRKL